MNAAYQITHFDFTPEGAALCSTLDLTPLAFVTKLFEVWNKRGEAGEELNVLSLYDGFKIGRKMKQNIEDPSILEDYLDHWESRLGKNTFGKFFYLNSVVFYKEDHSIHSIHKFRDGKWTRS